MCSEPQNKNEMKIKSRKSQLKKRAERGFRGYPVGTVAFYGPDDKKSTKVVVAVVPKEDAEPEKLQCWFAEDDVRSDPSILEEVVEFIDLNQVQSVVMTDQIIGCPHEEGVDYPEGQSCPQCPFWENRDRWSGNVIH